MALLAAWTQLEGELDSLALHFKDFASQKSSVSSLSHFSLLDECLLEGLLSRVWQAWNGFCRSCVIQSCMGTVDAAGLAVAGLPDALTEADVSGAAVLAKRRANPPFWGRPNTVLRFEPTWGDADVLVDVFSRLSPANSGKMLAAFSSVHREAKAVQTIRNGTAHNNAQTLSDVLSLQSAYVTFPISHPTQAMFWIDPTSSDFLITQAVEELKDAGLIAIS